MPGQTGSPSRRRIAGERPPRTTTRPAPAATVSLAKRPSGKQRDGAAAPAATLGNVPTWLLVGLGVLAMAALAFDLIAVTRATNEAALAETRTASVASAFNTAPAQAEKAAEQVLGFDFATLKQDTDEAKATMTPAYAEKFQKTVDDLLVGPLTDAERHVEAMVMASGVISATADEVEVLLFVDQVSTTKADPAPRKALNRVILSMVKSGDRWLVDDITAL